MGLTFFLFLCVYRAKQKEKGKNAPAPHPRSSPTTRLDAQKQAEKRAANNLHVQKHRDNWSRQKRLVENKKRLSRIIQNSLFS